MNRENVQKFYSRTVSARLCGRLTHAAGDSCADNEHYENI